MHRVGRLGFGLLGATLGATVVACSPADITGVTLADDGVPVLTNCGTWITEVEARDADTDRIVWSASMSPSAINERNGVGGVELGRRPDRDWIEDTPLALDGRPESWRFAVETNGLDRTTISVADDALAEGRVARPRHDAVSAQKFRDDVCGYAPWWWPVCASRVSGRRSCRSDRRRQTPPDQPAKSSACRRVAVRGTRQPAAALDTDRPSLSLGPPMG